MAEVAQILVGVFEKVGTLLTFFVDLTLPFHKETPPARRRKKNDDADQDSREGKTKTRENDFERKLFECPGCLDLPLPPIYSCSSGHIVCNVCREELNCCPVCSGDFKGTVRNFVVEQIMENKNFPCRFTPEGCQTVMKAKELLRHQRACRFRHVQCNVVMDGCCDGLGSWRGSLKKYYAHLVLVHEINFVFKNKPVLFKAQIHPETKELIEFISPTVALKVVQGRNFTIQPYFDPDSQNVFIFTTGMYQEDEEEETTVKAATVSIRLLSRNTKTNVNGNVSEIMWMGQVNSVYDDLVETLEKEDGLVIKWKDFIKECVIVNGLATWEFQVEIHPPVVVSTKPPNLSRWIAAFTAFKKTAPKYLQPFFNSAWSVVAPAFTILFILCFMLLV